AGSPFLKFPAARDLIDRPSSGNGAARCLCDRWGCRGEQSMSKTLRFLAAAAVVLGSGVAGAQVTSSQPVDAEQVLRVPAVNYRKEWVQLGTFSVLADKPQDGAKELHAVYTERKNLEAYLKDGKFPDGAVFVKYVWNAKTVSLTTGTSSFAGDRGGRFVMVKDTAGKLGSGPRFGD